MQFRQKRGDLIEAANPFLVADQIAGRGFGRGDQHRAARRVDGLDGNLVELVADKEGDTYLAAVKGAPGFCQHHLEGLGTLMGGAVILRGGQEPNIIGQILLPHESGNKLFGRKGAERAVLRRDDDIETAGGRCDKILARKPAESHLAGGGRDPEGAARVGGGKMIAPARGELLDKV